MASYKQAQEVIQSGNTEGWGKMIELPTKENMFGIGYQPSHFSQPKAQNRQGPITFSSAGIINYGQISAVDDEEGDNDCDIDNWICPCVPGKELHDWSSEGIIQVTLHKE